MGKNLPAIRPMLYKHVHCLICVRCVLSKHIIIKSYRHTSLFCKFLTAKIGTADLLDCESMWKFLSFLAAFRVA